MFINREKVSVIYLIFILTFLAGCSSNNEEQVVVESDDELSIFVATDIHFLDKGLNDEGNAFQTYLSSGDGKQLNYVDEITEAFLNDIQNKKPDVLVISGDLTNNGEKGSHLKLAEKFKNIEKTAGTQIFVIPGNHDIQNPWARGFQGEEQYVTDSVDSIEFENIYNDFGYKEAISKDESTLSYLVAPSTDVWLLMLDTNMYKYNFLYGAPVTFGEINQETCTWIRECSKLAKKNKAKIVTVMHHNLLDHSSVLNYGFTLNNSKEALELFNEEELNLILSGHVHIQDIKSNEEETRIIYDIATSSLSVYPMQYGMLKYTPTQGFDYKTMRVDVEGWAEKVGIKDENLTNFEEYSKNFFADFSYKKTYDSLTEVGIYSEQDKQFMAETLSLLNLNYFAGTINSARDEVLESQGYELWKIALEPEFLSNYVRSMVYDYKIDNNELHIPN